MKRKKIVIASSYFFPEKNAAANRLYTLASFLTDEYEVEVHTAAEDPVQARRELARTAAAEGTGEAAGPDVTQAPSTVAGPGFSVHYSLKENFSISNFFARFFREIAMVRRIRASVDLQGVSALIVSIPSMFLLPAFVRIAREGRGSRAERVSEQPSERLLVADVRDLVWEYLLQGGLIQRLSGALFKRMALSALEKFDLITVTNESERRYFTERFSEKRVLLVSNGIDSGRFARIRKRMEAGSGLSDPSAPALTVSYIGNVGIPQNLESLLRIARQMREARFIIAGGGSDLDRLKRLGAEWGLRNVEFPGFVEWERVLEIYRQSDVLYAKLDPAYIYAVPSKLYEYLATGLPVVYEGEGAAADLLRSFERVCIVSPGDGVGLEECFRSGARGGTELSENNIEKIRNEYLRERIFEGLRDELRRELNKKRED